MEHSNPLILALLIALAAGLSYLVCAFSGPVARRLAILDRPDGTRKLHNRPTPLVGGIALFAALMGALLFKVPLPVPVESVSLAAVTLFVAGTVLGYLDDRWSLSARFRLTVLAILAFIVMLSNGDFVVTTIHSGVFGGTQDLFWLAIPFSIFAIVGMTNAVNMADGLDGIVPGIGLIWASIMAPWAMVYAPDLLWLIFGAGAALVMILLFNLRGLLFMGDAGSYGVGVLFSLTAVCIYVRAEGAIPAEMLALWFGVPMVDALRLMIQRPIRGRHPFTPDREHFHHLLLRYMPRRMVVIVYWLLVLLPGSSAALYPQGLTATVIVASLVYTGLLTIGYRMPTTSLERRMSGFATPPAHGPEASYEIRSRVPGGGR